MKEKELTFVKIDPEEIHKRLISSGAEKVEDTVLKNYILWKEEWNDIKGRIRIRDNSKVITMAYKEQREENDFEYEVEFGIDDAEKAVEFLGKIGIDNSTFQAKRRVSYRLGDVDIDIDLWPMIDPILEIEGENEKELYEVVKKLGLKKEDAVILNANQIYKKYFDIDMLSIKKLDFEKDDWRLKLDLV